MGSVFPYSVLKYRVILALRKSADFTKTATTQQKPSKRILSLRCSDALPFASKTTQIDSIYPNKMNYKSHTITSKMIYIHSTTNTQCLCQACTVDLALVVNYCRGQLRRKRADKKTLGNNDHRHNHPMLQFCGSYRIIVK